MQRLSFDIVFFAAALIVPWWILFPLLLIPLFYFKFYVEALVVAIIIDALFFVSHGIPFIYTIATGILIVLAELIKSRMRAYTEIR